MRSINLYRINGIRIEPYPYFYVDYIAQDDQRLIAWELAALDQFPEQILNNQLIATPSLEALQGFLIQRRTKIYDNELKKFTCKLVRSFINSLTFKLLFLPNNQINIKYIIGDNEVSDEIYNPKIKYELRGIKQRISITLADRLSSGDDEHLVEETALPLLD